jgi:hypothetical protein
VKAAQDIPKRFPSPLYSGKGWRRKSKEKSGSQEKAPVKNSIDKPIFGISEYFF